MSGGVYTGVRHMRNLICCLLLSILCRSASAGTPREALLELATTRDARTIEKHLPIALIERIKKMPGGLQKEILNRFMIAKRVEEQKVTLVPSEDGQTLFVIGTSDWDSGYAYVRREIVNGVEAVEDIAFCSKGNPETCNSSLMFLKLEEGEWRLVEVKGGREHVNLEDPKYLAYLDTAPVNANESSAVGSMRTFNTSIICYETAFPERGVPNGLADLGSRDDQQEPAPDHAMLMDNSLACPESTCVKSGYAFQYRRGSKDEYSVIARPTRYGESGTRSFYSDESGVIRATDEDREATVNDKPI